MAVLTVVLWVLLAFMFCWMFLRYVPAGVDAKRPLTEMIALTRLLIAPTVIVLVIAAIIRDWPLTGASAALGLFWWEEMERTRRTYRRKGLELDRADKHENQRTNGQTNHRADERADGAAASPQIPQDPQHPQHLTIMTLNCRYGRASAQTIANAVKLNHVNVLALQEVDDDLYKAVGTALGAPIADPHPQQKSNAAADFVSSVTDSLTPGPLKQFLDAKNSVNRNSASTSAAGFANGTAIHGLPCDDDNGGFNALFADRPCLAKDGSIDLHAANVPVIAYPISDGQASGMQADASTAGHAVLVASAHPKSPGRGGAYWGYGLNHLADFAELAGKPFNQAELSSPTVSTAIVCGDLNSSLDFPSFRRVLKAGFADSTIEVNDGYKPTFPNSWPFFPDVLELDHVLHTAGVRAEKVTVIDVPGTDHAGLVVKLRLD